MTWHRKLLFITLPVFATGVAMCAGSVLAFRAVLYEPDPFEARPFDPEQWAKADSEGRAAMTQDAIRHLPAGMPEADALVLLGKGSVHDTRSLNGGHPPNAVRTHSYSLGSTRYDSTFLWVHIGADGRVIKAEIGGG